MAIMKKTELVINHKFDSLRKRHYFNGRMSVLHCHHYATLYTQLADDAKDWDGARLLRENSEDVFYNVLVNYYKEHGIEDLDEKISIAEQYYAAVGMGMLKIIGFGPFAGTVEMVHSHVDEGWIKKWGTRDKPVNFISQGYIAAVFAAINDLPPKSYQVNEIESIVCGASKSIFTVVRL